MPLGRSPASSATTSLIQASTAAGSPTRGTVVPSADRFGVVGASGGLQAPASAFWPRLEAVTGELVDHGAGGGAGQGSKSRRTRAWW